MDFTKIAHKVREKKPLYFTVRVIPKSPKNELTEILEDGSYKIRIAAPADKGKANDELIRFLATSLNINKNAISIVSGAKDRIKLVKITHESQS